MKLNSKLLKYAGRKTAITKKLIAEVQDLKETKNLSITQIAKITGRARSTIYKVLKEELNYIPYNRLIKAECERSEQEKTVVDWIGFKIQGSVDLKPITKYFFGAFGFNSTIAKRINGKWKYQVLKYDSRNQSQFEKNQGLISQNSTSYTETIQTFDGKSMDIPNRC